MEKIGIAQNLYKQYLIGKYCDLELEVESSKFLVHKCVFAAASWVLETILQSSKPVENVENPTSVSKHTVLLHGVTAYAISAILNYIYTGKLNPEVFVYNDKLEEILQAAKLYKLQELTEQLGVNDAAAPVRKPTNDESVINFGISPPLEANQLSEDLFHSCGKLISDKEIVVGPERGHDGNEQLSVTILNTDPELASDLDPVSPEYKLPEKEVQDHVLHCFQFSKDHGILYCLLCCKVFSNPNELINHMNEHKNETKRRSGSRPERAAAIAANVAASLALDNSTDIEIMESESETPERKRKKVGPKKSFLCADCGISYTTRMYLIRHYSVRHPNSFFCNFCGDHFPSSEPLQEHLLLHGGETQDTTLKTEHRRGRGKGKKGKKVFPCNLCAAVFGKKREMSLHLQAQHGISKPMHVCTSCGKEFKEKASLRSHTRVHTGEKPYMCSYCGNSFADQKTWKDHERRHRGEKPFLCTTCGKSFTYRQSFTRHMKFHEGKRPFQCSFCGKAFVLRQNLKEHEKRHTK